jgi:hypothetical protein
MGRSKFLRVAAVIVGVLIWVLLVSEPAFASPADCSGFSQWTGQCDVSGVIGDGDVDLSGTDTSPGSPGGGSASSAGGDLTGGTSDGTGSGIPPGLRVNRDEFGVIDPLTIGDLAAFHASAGEDHSEPGGWTIAGLDTNFSSGVATELIAGTLLDQPARVRFTPIAWHWNYGDGQSRVTAVPGASWAALGLGEFDPTPTSHEFPRRGTYEVHLGVEFTAEYTFAGGEWTPVDGTLTLPAAAIRIVAHDASTVLVGSDCAKNGSGPGC